MRNHFFNNNAAPPMSTCPADEEGSVTELLSILRRRRLTIIATIILLTTPVTLYAFWWPKYAAVVTVMIDPQVDKVISVEQVRPGLPADAATVETQASVIRSRPLIARTMEELGLFRDPEFNRSPLLRRLLSLVAEQPPVPEEEARRSALKLFENNLAVSPSGKSYVLQVAFSSLDPTKSAAVANRIVDLYVTRQLQQKVDATKKANVWLSNSVLTQQMEVLESEKFLAETRSEYQFIAGRGAALTATELEQLNRELIQTRAAQAKIEAKLALVDHLKANGGRLDTLPEAIASPVITQLRMQEVELIRRVEDNPAVYGEEHPKTLATRQEMAKISTRIGEEIDRIVSGLQNELSALSTQADAIQKQFQAAMDQDARANEATVRVRELERDAAAKRSLYETLLRRHQETSGQQGLLEPDARIISSAEVPIRPTVPPLALAAVGFVVSALGGCLLALLRDHMDTKLRTRRQVEHRLQVPCLGLVPSVRTVDRRSGGLHEYLRRVPRSAYTQSLRGLHAQLSAATPDSKVVLVTSSLPGEGKTCLAAGLAVCAAQAGARVVLVDFDLWSPSVARNFRLKAPEGATDLMAANAHLRLNLDKALVIDEATGVDVLLIGNCVRGLPNIPQRDTAALLEQLRQRYDRILIDSPPLLGMSDGRVLAACADATLFVIQWGRTNEDAAAAGLQVLRDVSAKVIGAVLTRVDLRRQRAFNDNLNYNRSFRKYYVA